MSDSVNDAPLDRAVAGVYAMKLALMTLLTTGWHGWQLRRLGVVLPASAANYARQTQVLAESGCVLPTATIAARQLRIGAHTYMHAGGSLNMVDAIGRYCSIGRGVTLGADGRAHPLDWLSSHPFQYNGATGNALAYQSEWQAAALGHDVWIGRDAIVMKGVKVGTGAVIGARSVVTRDVPPYAIVAGAPARILRRRFDEDTCARLLRSQWWNHAPAQLSEVPFNDIKRALDYLERPEKQALGHWQPGVADVTRAGRSLRILRGDALPW